MTTPILDVQQLSMRFGGLLALQDISFCVDRQSITGLIGPNGAGKTTLFNCLTGFYTATSGALCYYPTATEKSISIRQLLGFDRQTLTSPRSLLTNIYYGMFGGSYQVAKHGIARTFQNIRLFKEMSVIENLLVAQHITRDHTFLSAILNGPRYQQWDKQALNTAYQWLDYFSLTETANELAGSLAYGQQRLLEIARAMCTQPALICLDEPAAGLNPAETDALKKLIKQLGDDHQLTVILIEHDMGLVMDICDKLVVLNYGQLIAQGTPAAIQADPTVIAAYLGTEGDSSS